MRLDQTPALLIRRAHASSTGYEQAPGMILPWVDLGTSTILSEILKSKIDL